MRQMSFPFTIVVFSVQTGPLGRSEEAGRDWGLDTWKQVSLEGLGHPVGLWHSFSASLQMGCLCSCHELVTVSVDLCGPQGEFLVVIMILVLLVYLWYARKYSVVSFYFAALKSTLQDSTSPCIFL